MPKKQTDFYVACATWPEDKDGELVLEAYLKHTSLEEAQKRVERFKNKNPRIARLTFIDE